MERAQHARDVAQRQSLQPALVERSRRLTLEVDDHEVVPGVKHLAEVIVAVDPDPGRGQAANQKRLQRMRDLWLQLQHTPSILARILGEPAELASQQLHRAHRQPADRLVDRALVLR